MEGTVRIGTRGSALARAQAHQVADSLTAHWPAIRIDIVVIHTDGDRSQASATPLAAIGGQGVFVKEIEFALLRDEIDLAVHSLKDMATRPEPVLVLAAVPPREDARDVLISRHGLRLAELPTSPRIGTSSVRRAAQVRQARPDALIANLRGNIDSRLRKALTDDYDAIVLAAAGVRRLGRVAEITEYLPLDAFIPMVGQGALGLEIRADDVRIDALVQPLDDRATHLAVRAERAYLAALGSGCSAPVAAHAIIDGDVMTLHAMLVNVATGHVASDLMHGPASEPELLGQRLAARLLRQ